MLRILSFLSVTLLLHSTFLGQIQPPAGFSNNIILWLSPDTAVFEATNNTAEMNDRVVEWHDISGSGYVFSNTGGAVRPRLVTYQGKNMLNFVNGDYIENNGIASAINGLTEFSIYVVIKSDDVNTDQGFLDSENPDGADEIICMRYDASGANTGRTNLIKCGMQGNTANNQIESQSNTQTNQLQCLTLTWKQGEKINLYIDGVLNESSNNNLNTAMSGVQKILLGKGPKDTGGSSGWDGRIGTVIFYNTKMSPDTVSLVAGDLKAINSVQSGNWNDPNTWDCNCNPPNNAFVKINDNHTVTVTNNETVNNVIVNSLGSLTISGNRRLTFNRNFTNNGIFTSTAGEIRFSGNSEQLIDGSGTTNAFDITTNNNSGVRITNGSVNIQGTLNIQNGCLETGNRLTLLSNATGTARLNQLTGSACITGDITMQRYIDAGATDWRFITSAVSGATLADLNDDFITSGFTGSDFPFWPSASNPWPSIYFYDETVTGIQDNGFTAATNVTNSIGIGEGLWVWSGDTITGTQPFIIDVTGPANTGNINLPITYTNSGLSSDDGWNMVGNPYPSSIDWDSPNITKTNINNAIYIWNPDLQQFGSYVGGIGTNGGSNTIASSQAFWVQANAANPVIMVTETSKSTTDAAFLKPSFMVPFKIKVTNGYGSDEIAINFEANATNNFDVAFDAEKMTSVNTNLPRIASLTNNIEYSINQLPEQEISIPIKVTTGVSGLQQLEFLNVGALGNTACVIIEDLFTGSIYDLSTVNSITTYISDTTTLARFLLHVGAPYNLTTTNVTCNGNNDGKIEYTKNATTPFDIIWKDASNNVIATANSVFGDTLTNLQGGNYTVETTDALCGNASEIVTVNNPNAITSYYTTNADTINVGDYLTPTNLSTNATSYEWNFGDGYTTTGLAPMHTYAQAGTYLMNLKASQSPICFENYSKIITVVKNITGIDHIATINGVKTWISNNLLNVSPNSNNYQHIELRNALGQVIYSNLIHKDRISIDLSSFSNGIYIVTLTNKENHTESFKVNYTK